MNPLRSYSIVTSAYWSFMLTDGALRMLVLLYFHQLGYSAITLSFLFLFYEFFGIVTNLFGGWIAQRYGLRLTLNLGLFLQPLALIGLSFLDKNWPPTLAILFVMGIQALSGISKDLTKMSSKTAVKFLIPQDQSSKLFKWVAILTGSKNAIKGAGFFVGGLLLQTYGFEMSLWILSAVILVALLSSLIFLSGDMGQVKSKSKLRGIFQQKSEIKTLSAARVFLFGARDIWFVVAVPIYMTTQFGWNFTQVGTFMASWVIGYGLIQSLAPSILKIFSKSRAPDGKLAFKISAALTLVMASIALFYASQNLSFYPAWLSTHVVIIGGLMIFGAVFALNSSVHSFLVLEYADGDKVATSVGFYYMANAVGRLVGTLLSGLLFQWGGISYALLGSVMFLIFTSLISLKLPKST